MMFTYVVKCCKILSTIVRFTMIWLWYCCWKILDYFRSRFATRNFFMQYLTNLWSFLHISQTSVLVTPSVTALKAWLMLYCLHCQCAGIYHPVLYCACTASISPDHIWCICVANYSHHALTLTPCTVLYLLL